MKLLTIGWLLSRPARTRRLLLVLISVLFVFAFQSWSLTRSQRLPVVFELELPEFQNPPSSQAEIVISSSNVGQVLVHILRPAADDIDYGAIRTSVNGQAASPISEVVTGVRGKIVKIDLRRLPGYEFVNGRNTVEIWAQNRRGRMYYSSFVIRTATLNWNEGFIYRVEQAPATRNDVPPQIILLEPERPIEFRSGLTSMTVPLNGVVTSTSDIVRISVDGKNVPFKIAAETGMRQLTRVAESERSVSFQTASRIKLGTPQIVLQAEDKSGARTQVLVPVLSRTHGATPVAGQKFALIIGISKYKNNLKGVPNLDYADADAKSIYDFLQQPAGGGFARENMLLLANEQATTVGFRQAVTNFVARTSANDLLLIFFAGHGAPDPFALQNLYVITYDTVYTDMPHTALAMSELRRYIDENVKAKRVVLLFDACHSAGLVTEGTRDLANNLANLYLEKLLYQAEGRAIITSSDINEASRESQKWGNGHGVFTYYLLQGLNGNADTNGDRLVSVGELFRYVRQKVRLDTGFQQNPRMLLGENENLALSVARAR